MVDCNIWPQFFTPPCTRALCHVMCSANLPWAGRPALPPDCRLSPEQHTSVSRHNASTMSSRTEAGSLEPLPWLLDNKGQVEQSNITQSPHPIWQQDNPQTHGHISRTSVTLDTWAINTHCCVALMFVWLLCNKDNWYIIHKNMDWISSIYFLVINWFPIISYDW